jgi:hypothetical protein
MSNLLERNHASGFGKGARLERDAEVLEDMRSCPRPEVVADLAKVGERRIVNMR